MTKPSIFALKAGLSALHYSGVARALQPALGGLGAVFMLHHVSPEKPSEFAPNGLLQITPDFLDQVIQEVRRQNFDIVTLDEARARIAGKVPGSRPFACFTFDDGYRDNRDHAYPVLKRHGAPFTIYVASDFADGRGFLWWLVLERAIAACNSVAVTIDGEAPTFRCGTASEKNATFDRLYWRLRNMPETKARAIVAQLAADAGIDPTQPCRDLAMTWAELRELAGEPLVSIGAHTVRHMALAKLSGDEAFAEIEHSVARVSSELGRTCRHFCYPYGDAASASDREFDIVSRLGLATGVTTRKGVVMGGTRARMAALPRVSLNGNFQHIRFVKALLSGVPFALLNAMQRPAEAARAAYLPGRPSGVSGFCIQRTSQAAGSTHAMPPTVKNSSSPSLLPFTPSTTATSIARNA